MPECLRVSVCCSSIGLSLPLSAGLPISLATTPSFYFPWACVLGNGDLDIVVETFSVLVSIRRFFCSDNDAKTDAIVLIPQHLLSEFVLLCFLIVLLCFVA